MTLVLMLNRFRWHICLEPSSDAAGNRSFASATPGTWSYDNLNRMTASPWASYANDVLGNRRLETDNTAQTIYLWDKVNRMTYRGPGPNEPATGHIYTYRADGMRVRKQNQVGIAFDGSLAFNLSNNQVTRTYYEGQMPLEEEVIQGGSVQSLTRNFVGGRGLEAITTTENSATTTAYPLYDTHGNMVATLTKNASGTSWNVGNERTYDVWGGVRSGVATGGPKGRYCANLGHVQDDESGLIYMRARYYEPSTGRFISEDPAMDGANWFVYAKSSPTRYIDCDGQTASLVLGVVTTNLMFYWGLIELAYGGVLPNWAKAVGRTIIGSLIATTQYIMLVEFAAYVNATSPNPVAMHGAAVAFIGLAGAATVATLYAMMNFAWLIHILAIDDATWEEYIGPSQMIDPEVLL